MASESVKRINSMKRYKEGDIWEKETIARSSKQQKRPCAMNAANTHAWKCQKANQKGGYMRTMKVLALNAC